MTRTTKRLWTLIGALAFAATAAQAQVDPGKLDAAKKAAANFAELAKDSPTSGKPPRHTDPAVKKLLDAVYDASDVESSKAISFQALTPLGERMMTGVKVGQYYMLAGTGLTDISQAGADPKAVDKVNVNTVNFAPELGQFFDFQIKMQGAIIDAVEARLATAKPEELNRPNFKSGLAQIRSGSARTTSGLIETLALNGLTDEWRRDRLPALTMIGPKLAKFLEPGEKTDLQQLALNCAHVMDDAKVKQTLEDFAKTIGKG